MTGAGVMDPAPELCQECGRMEIIPGIGPGCVLPGPETSPWAEHWRRLPRELLRPQCRCRITLIIPRPLALEVAAVTEVKDVPAVLPAPPLSTIVKVQEMVMRPPGVQARKLFLTLPPGPTARSNKKQSNQQGEKR